MKTFIGTFANGEKYMGVEKPESAHDFHSLFEKKSNSLAFTNSENKLCSVKLPIEIVSILGTYQTKGEIDFEEKMDWCDFDKFGNYKDYSELAYSRFDEDFTLSDSLLSLLDRDSRMAFPLEENPNQMPNTRDFGPRDFENDNSKYWKLQDKWREAESQVRPKKFLIILVK